MGYLSEYMQRLILNGPYELIEIYCPIIERVTCSIIALGYLHKLRHLVSMSYMFAISRLRSQIQQSDFNTKLRFLFKRPFIEVLRRPTAIRDWYQGRI